MKSCSRLEKLIVIVVAFVLSLPVVACSGVLVANAISEKLELYRVASQLGSRADWDAVRYAVYCQVLAPGKERHPVEDELRKLGDFRNFNSSEYGSGEYIFVGGHLKFQLQLMRVIYSSNRITSVSTVIGEGGSDTVETQVNCAQLKLNLEK